MSKAEDTEAQELAFAWESVKMPLDTIAEMYIKMQERMRYSENALNVFKKSEEEKNG